MTTLLASISPDQFVDKTVEWVFAGVVVIVVIFGLVRYGKDLYEMYFGD